MENSAENTTLSENQRTIEKYSPILRKTVADYFAAQKIAELEGTRPLTDMTFDNPTGPAVDAVLKGTFEIRSVHVNLLLEEPQIRVSVAPNVELVITGMWAHDIIVKAEV